MFYVINLERRNDRKEMFEKRWGGIGIDSKFEFVKALDGTKNEIMCKALVDRISVKINRYDSNPRIVGCIYSHLKVWEKIANGEHPYGIVLEDDVLFSDNFNDHWGILSNKLDFLVKKDIFDIIYLGCGDILPIHTNPPTRSLLESQEKSHVKKIKYGCIGHPRDNSAYIFDWFGAFSYCLSRESARRLLDIACRYPINNAIDVWLKENIKSKKRFVSVPLMTYHPPYDLNIYDSDTWGVGIPYNIMEKKDCINKYSICFLIPTYGRSETLLKTVESIIDNSKYKNNLFFAFYHIFKDDKTINTIQTIRKLCKTNDCTICVMSGPANNRIKLHEIYNSLWRCYFKACKFFSVWDDHTTISTPNWDVNLYNSYDALQKPSIACFQFSKDGRTQFKNPILTENFINNIGYISPLPCIEGYINFISSLSSVTVFLSTIKTDNLEVKKDTTPEIQKYLYDILHNSALTKDIINDDIIKLKKYPYYTMCGAWANFPKDWSVSQIIGNPKLYNFL